MKTLTKAAFFTVLLALSACSHHKHACGEGKCDMKEGKMMCKECEMKKEATGTTTEEAKAKK